jgi:nucleoside-diphosphate-sugar epimerase
MAEIFVTGGSGFIGLPFVRLSLEAGHQVQTVARSEKALALLKGLGATAIKGDLLEAGNWQQAATRAEIIVHLAQPPTFGARISRQRAQTYQQQRLTMDRLLLESLNRLQVKKIIYVAGTSYYGDQGTALQTEEATPNPKGWGPYIAPAIEKLPAYLQTGLPIVEAYPGPVYGPGSWFEEYTLAPLKAGKPAYRISGPQRVASLVHYEDVARAILHLIEAGEVGKRYFVVDDQPVKGDKMTALAAQALGITLRYQTLPFFLVKLLSGPVISESVRCDANLSNARLKASGFKFKYPTVETGIPAVVSSWLAQTTQQYSSYSA